MEFVRWGRRSQNYRRAGISSTPLDSSATVSNSRTLDVEAEPQLPVRRVIFSGAVVDRGYYSTNRAVSICAASSAQAAPAWFTESVTMSTHEAMSSLRPAVPMMEPSTGR